MDQFYLKSLYHLAYGDDAIYFRGDVLLSGISRGSLAHPLIYTTCFRYLGLVCIDCVDAKTLYRREVVIYMAFLAVYYDPYNFAVNCGEDDTFFEHNIVP